MELSNERRTYQDLVPLTGELSLYTDFEEVVRLELWGVHIESENIRPLYRRLFNSRTIREVNLTGNRLGEEELLALIKAFDRHCTLESLTLSNQQIGSQAVAIADVVCSIFQLAKLDMSENKINDEGACSLAQLLGRGDGALTHLNLTSNCIGDPGAIAVAKQIRYDRHIAAIRLGSNQIGQQGLSALAKAVERSSCVTDLELWGNSFLSESMEPLHLSLHQNRYMRSCAFTAVKEENIPSLHFWFDSGVSARACDQEGQSLLEAAVERGSPSLVKELLYWLPSWRRRGPCRLALERARQMGCQELISLFQDTEAAPCQKSTILPVDPLERFTAAIPSIEAQIGYRFIDKELLQRAFTHQTFRKKYPNLVKHDNERLEWVGDSILGSIVTEYLDQTYPALDEEGLTIMRSNATSNIACESYIVQLGVGHYLLQAGEGVGKKALADLFEALVGAIYKDGGIAAARELLLTRVEMSFHNSQLKGEPQNKDEFQRLCHIAYGEYPLYEKIWNEIPDEGRYLTVVIKVERKGELGRGYGTDKKQAMSKAVAEATRVVQGDIGRQQYVIAFETAQPSP